MQTTMRRQDTVETAKPFRHPAGAGRKRRGAARCIAALAVLAPGLACAADRALLTLAPVPADGIVVTRVDLSAPARWCGRDVVGGLRVIDRATDRPLSAQFVPDDGHGASGTLVLKCDPARPTAEVWLDFSAPAIAPDPAGAVTVSTRWAVVTHDPREMGGMPAAIAFAGAAGPPVPVTWNDRLFTRDVGQFALRYDREARVRRLSAGPLCTVVRVEGRCVRADGTGIDPQPRAVYDWFYFHDSPRIYVQGTVRQDTPRSWGEAHFLELAFATNVFSAWVGGEPRQEGVFGAELATPRFPAWGAVFNDRGEIGISAAGGLTVYNGGARGPRYLHAHADAAWQGWSGTELRRDAWLWMVPRTSAAKPPAGPAVAVPAPARAGVSVESLRKRIDEAYANRAASSGKTRADWGWRGAVLRLLEERGLYREAADLPPGGLPDGWLAVPAGDLRVLLQRRPGGISLLNLVDAATGTLLLGTDHAPVFDLALRREGSTDEERLSSESGWGDVTVGSGLLSDALTLRWRKPAGTTALGDLEVTVRIRPDAERHRVSWSLEARGQAAPWSVWEVRFPQVVLSAPGSRSQLALPQ
ncbi:MAG: hypothetical protein KJ579_11455, partial [Verrucomicrobia bacterium]|nr:hypothetical protein [Verrucomicrobiota bacterium]